MGNRGFDEDRATAEKRGIVVIKVIDFMELEGLKNCLQPDNKLIRRGNIPTNDSTDNLVRQRDSVKFANTGVDGQDFGIETL